MKRVAGLTFAVALIFLTFVHAAVPVKPVPFTPTPLFVAGGIVPTPRSPLPPGNVIQAQATTAGTASVIPKFVSPSALQDSVIVENSGRIGIGTSAPAAQLDVAGDIKLSSGGRILFADGSAQSSAPSTNISAADSSLLVSNGGGQVSVSVNAAGITTSKLANGSVTLAKLGADVPVSNLVSLTANNTFTGAQTFTLSNALTPAITAYNSATSQSASAINAESASGDGVGIVSAVTGTSGQGIALLGRSSASLGAGVRGEALALDSTNFGVVGVSHSSQGIGVQGQTDATSGTNYGVYGTTSGTQSSAGVYGASTTTSNMGINYGVYGTAQGPYGVAVFGYEPSTTGSPVGVAGKVSASAGIAGQFTNTAATGNVIVASGGTGKVFRVDVTGNIYMNGTVHTTGADFAEEVDAAPGQVSSPGDVLVIDGDHNRAVRLSSEPYATNVLGVHATKPGVLASPRGEEANRNAPPVAMIGIVPCKASAENGPIRRGDLLVTSATPGHVMRATDRARVVGAIVGKALESLETGTGVIEIAVTLQ